MVDINIITDDKIIEEYKNIRDSFRMYFKGFVHHNANAMSEFGTFLGKIEVLLFGDALF